jgi:hypothetical protein
MDVEAAKALLRSLSLAAGDLEDAIARMARTPHEKPAASAHA